MTGLVQSIAARMALLLGTANASQGAGLIGYKPTLTYAANTLGKKLHEAPSLADKGAAGDTITDDTAARTAALAGGGIAFYAPGYAGYLVTTWNGPGTTGPVTLYANTYESDETNPSQGTVYARRYTTTAKDAFYAEHYGTGTGYAVHGISYATTGSGVGGASWGTGAGIVGNKRGTGVGSYGNGVYGAAGIDNGDSQTGVAGQYTGSGANGTGVSATHAGTATTGNALFAWRSGTGGGSGAQVLRDGAGGGVAMTVTRGGSGIGDALDVTQNSTGGGCAVTASRQDGSGNTWSIGYLGYYDGTQSIGVYGTAPAGGTTQWAGRFDGKVYITGLATLGAGAIPLTDNGSNFGSASFRWSTIYAANNVINTSDRDTKQDIASLDAAEARVGARLRASIKKYRFRDAVAAKDDGARIHVGVIAQDVRDAFTAEGLDATRYGVFCSDTWIDEDGQEKTRLGVRYDQLFAFVVAAL